MEEGAADLIPQSRSLECAPMPGDDDDLFAGVEQKLGFWSAVFSLSLSMIGTGVVAFPYGFALCGYLVGPVWVFSIGILAYFSYMILTSCTATTRVSSWGDLFSSLNPAWRNYANVSLVIMLVLALASYVMIAGNVVSCVAKTLHIPAVIMEKHVLFAIMLAIMLPFVLAKSLNGLAKLANFCTFALFMVVLGVIVECSDIMATDPPASSNAPIPTPSSALQAVPIFACAAFGHMNMPQIYAELRPELKPKASRIVAASMVGTVALYLTIGVVGYLAFGKLTAPDIVKQIAENRGETPIVGGIHACLASFIILKCPLLVLPTRSVLLAVFGKKQSDLNGMMHLLVTLAILAVVYVSAIAFDTLNQILEILGAVVVIPLCFIIPARLSWSIEVPKRFGLCVFMAGFGTIAAVLSLVAAIKDIAGQ